MKINMSEELHFEDIPLDDGSEKKDELEKEAEKGEKETYGLRQSDVGAIFLGRIDSEFVHHDDDNHATAAVRKSGMFLHESDGHAGGVQHVDFAT